ESTRQPAIQHTPAQRDGPFDTMNSGSLSYMKTLIAVVATLVLLAGGWYAYVIFTARPAFAYRMAEVKRGDLLATISATGTLEPEEVVDVGAQVAGQIM